MNHIYEVIVDVRGNGYLAGYTKTVHVEADNAIQAKALVRNAAVEQKLVLAPTMKARKVF